MTTPQRISIVTLGVADLTASTAFYEAIGWAKSASSMDTITFFQMEGSILGLYEQGALADDAHTAAVPASGDAAFRGVTLAINLASPADVDASFASWVAAGATAQVEPHAAFWGGYSSYVADPDGHLWELAHNPYWEIGADGRVVLAPPAA